MQRQRKARRILEVSDARGIREIVKLVSQKLGYEVIEATCGDEAIVLYKKQGPFDFVLTDLYYFDHITEPPLNKTDTIRDGIQLAQTLRTLAPAQRIVIHTGGKLHLPEELADIQFLVKGDRKFLHELRTLLSIENPNDGRS